MSDSRSLLITVHGIRTFGQWQNRLRDLVLAKNPDIDVKEYGYGYFSVIAFLIPIVRHLAVIAFRRRLLRVLAAHPGASVSIVAHSFGTHIVAHALQGMKDKELPRIKVIILAGSVLKSDFDWSRLLGDGRPTRVINDCGIDDGVLLLSQLFVLLTGMAGRVGFYGFSDDQVLNRFFIGGHSHYFQPPGNDPDAFMKLRWVPILAGGATPQLIDERVRGGPLQGASYALMKLADPIKIAAYLSVAYLLTSYAYLEPRRQIQWESARRQYQAAASQLSDDDMLAGGVSSLARLVAAKSLQTDAERDRAVDLARFGLQRLVTRDEALAGVDAGRFFHSGDATYFKGGGLTRVIGEDPAGQIFDAARQVTFLVSLVGGSADEKKVRISAFDVASGNVIVRHEIDLNGGKLDHGLNGYLVKSDPHRFLLMVSTREIEGDNSHTKILGFDIKAGTVAENPAEDILFHNNCSDVAWINDEDDKKASFSGLADLFSTDAAKRFGAFDAASDYKTIDQSDCVSKLEAWTIPALHFPRAKPELELFSAKRLPEQTPTPDTTQDAANCGTSIPDGARFAGNLVVDVSQLILKGSGSEAATEQAKEAIEGNPCALLLSGPNNATYIAGVTAPGQWIGAWVICDLSAGNQVRECGIFEYASEGGGHLWFKSGSELLVIRDAATETNAGGFSVVNLVSKQRMVADPPPGGRARAAKIDPARGLILIAFDVPGWQDATDIKAYQVVGNRITLAGSRRFNPPLAPLKTLPSEDSKELPDPQLELVGDHFVLSTASQSIVGLDVELLSWWRHLIPDFMASWIGRNEDRLSVLWTVQFTNYVPGQSPPRLAIRTDNELVVAYSETKARVLHAADGTTLSLVSGVAKVSQECGSKLTAAKMDETDRVILESADCRIERAPPISRKEMEARAAMLQSYLVQLDQTAAAVSARRPSR